MRVERGTSDAKRGRGGATIHRLIHSCQLVSLSLFLSQRTAACEIFVFDREHARLTPLCNGNIFFRAARIKAITGYFFLGMRQHALCASIAD